MKLKIYTSGFLAIILLLCACKKKPDDNCENSPDWIIPSCEVFDGGPGKDGIPSVDEPNFSLVADVDYLSNNDLVIGVYMDGQVKAYPHPILNWHEIVNDVVGNVPMAITYCPLTGTAIGWDRTIEGEVTTFGVSGLLYNTNLIPYDRKTDSNWSQIFLKGVNGELASRRIQTYPVIETTWDTWKKQFPNSEVMNTSTGFGRDYDLYPYGDYRSNDNALIFPISNDDSRLGRKDRGLGVLINNQAKFYPVDRFVNGTFEVVSDYFQETQLVIMGSQEMNFVVVYESLLPDGTELQFAAVESEDNSLVLMEDQEGNQWNMLGVAISGPRTGERLNAPESFVGFWFAWAAFYPNPEIF